MERSPLIVERAEPRVRSAAGPVRVAVAAYVAATLLGVVMRMDLAGVPSGVPFDHLLHAHSHTLYFGWAAVGLLAVSLDATVTGWFRLAVRGALLVVPALFVGFLAVGYHPVTIAISTVAMLAWYIIAVGWWRRLETVPSLARFASRTGLAYLVISSLGVWALAGVQATGGSELAESLAIHAFLLGFGWFLVFVLVGALILRADRAGWSFDDRSVRRTIRWWTGLAWVTFPLGVLGGPEVGVLGPAARVAGVLLLVPGLWWVTTMWSAATGRDRILFRLSAAWFGLTTVTTAAVGFVGTSAIAAGGRQGVVIHLHALFVGFLTPLLALLLAHRTVRTPLLVHHVGLTAMLAGLATIAVGHSGPGVWLALAGGVIVWSAGVRWVWLLWRSSP